MLNFLLIFLTVLGLEWWLILLLREISENQEEPELKS